MRIFGKISSAFVAILCIISYLIMPSNCLNSIENVDSINSVTEVPKVSVIIPVYNTEPYLKECLDSVKNQTLKDIEIICVNDGSTDKSGEILDEYAKDDSRIIVLNQENKGGAAARNSGLKVAKGEYIAFVDSDDTIDKNAYYVAYNKINKVNADILMFGEDKYILPNKFYKSGFDAINVPGMWALWNKLYKRKFLLDNNFELPEHAKVCHDECFNTVVFPKAKGVICIKDKFYHYRRNRNNSIQNSADIKVKANYYLVFADYVCDNWRKNGYLKNYGFWLLGRLSDFSNRIIDHLSVEDKHWYAKSLMDIIGDDIYNDSNINKLSKNKKLLLRKWTKYLKG